MRASAITTAVLAANLVCEGVFAQERPRDADAATVRMQRVERDRRRVESDTRFATSIDLRARGALAESVSELLDEAPGLHVRRMGDGFSPQSITLRGAPGAQIVVALDGVVLNDAASDGVDLALIPPAMLERADVHRGFAPMRLGVSGLAGAIELTTRQPDDGVRAWGSAGYGSFGARRASLVASVRGTRGEGLVALGYRGTNGDFTFYDDGASPRLGGVIRDRQNAAADAIDLLARACATRSDGSRALCLMALAGWRDREVPGPGSSQADGPYATQRRTLARLTVPFARGEVWAALVQRDDVFWNTGATTLYYDGAYVARSHGDMVEAGVTARVRSAWFAIEPVLRVRHEGYSGNRLRDDVSDAARESGLAGYEAEARFTRVRFTQASGVELLRDRGPGGDGFRAPFSVRAGLSWAPTPRFELRANGGHAQRAPTLPELYGDRGFIRANPALRPEAAWNFDLGAVLTASRGILRARFELAGYVREARDMIVLERVNRSAFQPANLASARVLGLEAHGRLALGRVASLTASYALIDARNQDEASGLAGYVIPGVPRHDLYVALDGVAEPRSVGQLRAGVSLSYASEAYLEDSNTASAVIPARALLGATASWRPAFASRVTLGVTASNLLDQRTASITRGDGSEGRIAIQDYFGYPLPGRSLFVSLTVASGRDAP